MSVFLPSFLQSTTTRRAIGSILWQNSRSNKSAAAAVLAYCLFISFHIQTAALEDNTYLFCVASTTMAQTHYSKSRTADFLRHCLHGSNLKLNQGFCQCLAKNDVQKKSKRKLRVTYKEPGRILGNTKFSAGLSINRKDEIKCLSEKEKWRPTISMCPNPAATRNGHCVGPDLHH